MRGTTLKLNSGIPQHVNNTQSPRKETVANEAGETTFLRGEFLQKAEPFFVCHSVFQSKLWLSFVLFSPKLGHFVWFLNYGTFLVASYTLELCSCIPFRPLWTWYSGIGQSGPGGSTLYSIMNVFRRSLLCDFIWFQKQVALLCGAFLVWFCGQIYVYV